eukprot:gene22725-biopygen14801
MCVRPPPLRDPRPAPRPQRTLVGYAGGGGGGGGWWFWLGRANRARCRPVTCPPRQSLESFICSAIQRRHRRTGFSQLRPRLAKKTGPAEQPISNVFCRPPGLIFQSSRPRGLSGACSARAGGIVRWHVPLNCDVCGTKMPTCPSAPVLRGPSQPAAASRWRLRDRHRDGTGRRRRVAAQRAGEQQADAGAAPEQGVRTDGHHAHHNECNDRRSPCPAGPHLFLLQHIENNAATPRRVTARLQRTAWPLRVAPAQPIARRHRCPALVAGPCRDPRRFSTARRFAPSSTHRHTADASITLAPSPTPARLAPGEHARPDRFYRSDIQLVV